MALRRQDTPHLGHSTPQRQQNWAPHRHLIQIHTHKSQRRREKINTHTHTYTYKDSRHVVAPVRLLHHHLTLEAPPPPTLPIQVLDLHNNRVDRARRRSSGSGSGSGAGDGLTMKGQLTAPTRTRSAAPALVSRGREVRG